MLRKRYGVAIEELENAIPVEPLLVLHIDFELDQAAGQF